MLPDDEQAETVSADEGDSEWSWLTASDKKALLESADFVAPGQTERSRRNWRAALWAMSAMGEDPFLTQSLR